MKLKNVRIDLAFEDPEGLSVHFTVNAMGIQRTLPFERASQDHDELEDIAGALQRQLHVYFDDTAWINLMGGKRNS